jgi:hypothetical protein
MKHEAGGYGASRGQIAISIGHPIDDFAMHAKPICQQNAAGRYEGSCILKTENEHEAHLN